MGSFLLFILIAFLVFVGGIGVFVLRFVRLFSKQTGSSAGERSANNNRHNDQQTRGTDNDNHQKVFSKEEGEYIDYEEVK